MLNTTMNYLTLFKKPEKQVALLIDPDKQTTKEATKISAFAQKEGVDFIFVGGSLVSSHLDETIKAIKKSSTLPIFLFPGSVIQISAFADGILFISLISGRNPEFLIGSHVIAAPILQKMKLEILPVGYILIEGGNVTSVEYMSNTKPIPYNKPDIAAATALAGQFLGNQIIYMDAGSGAKKPVSEEMIRQVKAAINTPLIVGGGIKTPEIAYKSCKAGADILVIGTAAEKDKSVLPAIIKAIKPCKT